MTNKKLPGLNIQTPWARLLMEGEKTVETRTYPLPERYVNQDFWLIETPGRIGKFKARVIGKIRFSGFKQYRTASEFYEDHHKHQVGRDDPDYRWQQGVKKYGWIVSRVESTEMFPPPKPRGIVYAAPFSVVPKLEG